MGIEIKLLPIPHTFCGFKDKWKVINGWIQITQCWFNMSGGSSDFPGFTGVARDVKPFND